MAGSRPTTLPRSRRAPLLSHEAGRRVPEHVGRHTGWKAALLDGRLPDPVPPVGESDHRTVGRREDRGIRTVSDVPFDVHIQVFENRLGHLHQSGAMRLGVPLDESVPVPGHRTLDGQSAEVVEVAPAQSDGPARSQSAVGEHEDEPSPPLPDGIGKQFDLLGSQGQAGLTRPFGDPEPSHGVGGESPRMPGRISQSAGC